MESRRVHTACKSSLKILSILYSLENYFLFCHKILYYVYCQTCVAVVVVAASAVVYAAGEPVLSLRLPAPSFL